MTRFVSSKNKQQQKTRATLVLIGSLHKGLLLSVFSWLSVPFANSAMVNSTNLGVLSIILVKAWRYVNVLSCKTTTLFQLNTKLHTIMHQEVVLFTV